MKYIKLYETKQFKNYLLIKSKISIAKFPYYIIYVANYDNDYIWYSKFSYINNNNILVTDGMHGHIKLTNIEIYAQSDDEKELLQLLQKELPTIILNTKFNL